jgi:threonine synthase
MEFGVQEVCIKNEGQNPTGSHKDRMSPLAIGRAISAGYSKVLASSSGNAGASLASYAARAGLKCCIIVGKDISRAWEDAIRLSGAEVQRHDSHERWPQMQEMVQKDGWFPVTNFWPTPIGSNPFGIEGYKTIAYEIVEQHKGAPPTIVIIPTCRGDVLYGISRGFAEAVEAGMIDVAPRLVAVEPGSRLELVLNGADYRTVFEVAGNNMTSIDGGTVTYQSWMALQSCNGTAVSVTSEDAKSAQRQLAMQGFHVETSSASALAGLRQLQKRGQLNPNDRVVMLITSHGYKEPVEQSVPSTNRLCN